ncbi:MULTISPECIES: hydroxymethylbilane synthase [Glutamicibacter]|jgi:hydroxymethylbilane synthase|uniref:Porphobilinogen deaminase n=2 Tax=Glutamicibacter arilaitensis TaxID=256701 RepID=A0A2N7S2X5_9MICC|nr:MULTISPECIES: hydroxymethylbilane synthase [Glutamicibacter]PMQ20508.1 hydroxymethylbilane synthase [Glutamicibacter arilaitensis]TFH56734.1 hydroxymethylbilane synthase [Glutamicibacter arilaitensis]CBT76366.1 hydroxymethylbilane synthase [Glutamicibacter arilaitensis Re117]HCH47763.1 hydroxymethylbilane synthase [Glutamicibacter sp.]HCJ53164.1 hydroxymethylbilane synthase [Glutamicibacter sp.]
MSESFRVGTRGSALATTQTGWAAQKLAGISGLDVETVLVKTEGDVVTGSLATLGGTGVFAAALRQHLLDAGCDLAVHSLKDLPTAQPEGLVLAAIPAREDVRDALCSRDSLGLDQLPHGAKIGTGSPRRAAQLLAYRSDFEIVDIRGNVPTRLGRVKGVGKTLDDGSVGRSTQGDLDAVILAAAGMRRLGLEDHITEYLDPSIMLPAPGQGALALETRSAGSGHQALDAALSQFDDAHTRMQVEAERALLSTLEAGCAAPIGALAHIDGDDLVLEAVACNPDGSETMRRSARIACSTTDAAQQLGRSLAQSMIADGAAVVAGLA